MKELQIRYNVDYKGKPYNTNNLDSVGVMSIYLDKIFQEKPLKVMRGKRLLKFVLQAGSEEQIEYLHVWLQQNSPTWFKKFEIMKTNSGG